MSVISEIFVRYFKLYTHVHLPTMEVHISNVDNVISILYFAVIFVIFFDIYVNNSQKICIRSFLNNLHLHTLK